MAVDPRIAIPTGDKLPFRRIKVPISLNMLIAIIRQGTVTDSFRCIDGVPPMAAFVGSYFDPNTKCGYLIFESDEFEEHSAAEEYPCFVPTFEKIHTDDLEGWE